MFSTPVLLILFNRPHHTARTFQAIRGMQPARLFVAADGPRPQIAADAEHCRQALQVVEEGIDWPCNVQWLMRDQNLGCGLAVSGAISWFFQQVEEGIILEDDCMPGPAFFHFAEGMLQRYRHHTSVMHISGAFFLGGILKKNPGPFISMHAGIWGRASWRRAWQQYEYRLTPQNAEKALLHLSNQQAPQAVLHYWRQMFDLMVQQKIDTWDYQWHATIWANEGLTISPGQNLVENIGFGADATHTTETQSRYANQPAWQGSGLALAHTKNIIYRKHLDRLTEQWSLQLKPPPSALSRIMHVLRRPFRLLKNGYR